uniref:Uncharacterized protein n=1 Tax=Anguilla anguilla TaxID=7936 RepID=A0A0E9PQ37_ANGAN
MFLFLCILCLHYYFVHYFRHEANDTQY